MHATSTLESRMADAWQAQAEERLGDWRLRAAGGFTGRANSALTVGDPGVGLDRALRTAVEFARRHRVEPTAHVVAGSPLEPELAGRGWSVNLAHPGGAESSVLVAELDGAVGPANVAMHSVAPPGWWALAVGSERPTEAQQHVLGTGDLVGFGVCTLDDEVVAVVRGAVVADTLHVARLAVSPAHKRQGLASVLMAGVMSWGKSHGASHCALQVATGNAAAHALYRGLGFVEHHRYRYWVPGPRPVSDPCEDRTP